jgi:hypothetical protein
MPARALSLLPWMLSILLASEARLAGASQPPGPSGAPWSAAGRTTVAPRDPPIGGVPVSIDDLLSAVSNQVPGFGGMFIGSRDRGLKIYLLDPGQIRAAQVAIAAVFGRGRVPLATAQALPAQYSFLQLREWHNRHRMTTLAMPGVVMTSIHKASNRLRIGVARTDVIGPVQRQLAALGVPLAAVEIVVMQPFQDYDTLADTHRPLIGGLSITACTLGFLAVRAGEAGFVTNSHCTINRGVVNGDPFHQTGNTDGATLIGHEVADPPYFTDDNPDDCPSGLQCRFSDSAFIKRDGGPSQSTPRAAANFGHIAFTPNGLTITSEFVISGKVFAPIDGEQVSKVGKTTGLTTGFITDTCADSTDGMGFAMLCQDTVMVNGQAGAGGDSGSPVFSTDGSTTGGPNPLPRAFLNGILWGGNGGGNIFAFSPISSVEIELGPLRTFLGEPGVNSPPEVKIRQPLDQSTVGVGGLSAVSFQADAVDYEGCCQDETWQSDVDGVMGHGPVIEFTFPSPGVRKVTFTATDNDGAAASDSIQVTAATGAPTVSILAPPTGQTLYVGFDNLFQGTSFDPNEPFFTMPCSALTWSSNKLGDPFPVTGCTPQAVFPNVGPRTITLSGTDSFNLTASAAVDVNVTDVPPNAAPIVTILNPHNGDLLPASTLVTLLGQAQDPANQSPLTFQWLVIDGATTTILATGAVASGGQPSFQWTPSDNVPFSCGGRHVTLRLTATNPGNQTGVAEIDVKIGYSPC